MRHVFVVISLVGFLGLLVFSASAGVDYRGICYASWQRGQYSSVDSTLSLGRLGETNANYVGLVVTWYMDDHTTSNLHADSQLSPSDDDVEKAISDIESLGMKVMLKLHLNVKLPDGKTEWAGEIYPNDVSAWFSNYQAYVNHYAQIAASHRDTVELFCIGTELVSMTVSDYHQQWLSIISQARSIYPGQLTFSAGFYQEYKQIDFWNQLDIASIAAYFELIDLTNPDPTLDQLAYAWQHSWNWPYDWVAELEDWQSEIGKPVIFTELGYCSVDYAAYKPWAGPGIAKDENFGEPTYNGELQARCYQAAFRIFRNKDWFKGFFIWVWTANPNEGLSGESFLDYTPQNKPAEAILKSLYSPTGVRTWSLYN